MLTPLGPAHRPVHPAHEAAREPPAVAPRQVAPQAELPHALRFQSANNALPVAADPIPAPAPAPSLIPLAQDLPTLALPVLVVLPLAHQKSLSRS